MWAYIVKLGNIQALDRPVDLIVGPMFNTQTIADEYCLVAYIYHALLDFHEYRLINTTQFLLTLNLTCLRQVEVAYMEFIASEYTD